MCAIYAFMRYCDDLSDEPGANRAAIERWRAEHGRGAGGPLRAATPSGRRSTTPCAASAFRTQYFREMIDGVASDLEPRRFQTFDELYRYCYQVASVVGLTIIHIFGFDTPQRPAAGRKVRRGVSAHQHPARHPRGCRARPHLSAGRRPAPLRRDAKRICAAAKRSERFRAPDALRSRARARLLRRIAAAAGPDPPAQPARRCGR